MEFVGGLPALIMQELKQAQSEVKVTAEPLCTRPLEAVLRTTAVAAAGLHVTRPTRHHLYVLEAALLHLSEANVQTLQKPQP